MEQIVVWAVPAAALFFSLLFFILSKVLYRSHLQKFATYTAEVQGVLVGWQYHHSTYRAGVDGWFPIVSYDVGGEHYEKEEPIAYPKEGEAGIATVIHYDPEAPYKFYMNKEIYLRQVRVFRLASYTALFVSLVFFYIVYELMG